MPDYKKFLIQQQSYNGSQYTNIGGIVDTQMNFCVACQNFPFKELPEIKELSKFDWPDEDGEDVYVPASGYRFKAYDVEAEFIYLGDSNSIRNHIKQFIDFLYGRIDSSGNPLTGSILLAIYDEYTQTGKRGVYVKEVNNTLYYDESYDPDSVATFKVVFHVTDPVTDIDAQMEVVA